MSNPVWVVVVDDRIRAAFTDRDDAVAWAGNYLHVRIEAGLLSNDPLLQHVPLNPAA